MKGSRFTVAVGASLFAPIEASRMPLVPKATVSVDLAADGWTPKPTSPPGGLTKLHKRKSSDEDDDEGSTALVAPDNTCGYVSARPGAHFTCSSDYSCVFFTASSSYTGYVGCCGDVDCGVRLDCIDYDGYYSSSYCDDGCRVDAFTLKCIDSDLPYCNTVSFSSNIYDYWCNSLPISSAQSATTAYAGNSRSFSPLPLTDESASFSLSGDTSAGGPGPTASAETSTATESSGGGNGDNGDDDNNKDGDDGSDGSDDKGSKKGDDGPPVGPIVGGVVGGVGAIGLGGLGLWLFFRNKKKKQAAAAAAAQPSPSVAYAPVQQQGPAPPGQPGFDQQTGYYNPKFVAAGPPYQQYPQQQPQQPGGFYPMGNTPPPPQSSVSPSMSYADPNNPSSPSTGYPSGVVAQSPQSQAPSQQGGFIAEAPSRPEETHRGGVHELG